MALVLLARRALQVIPHQHVAFFASQDVAVSLKKDWAAVPLPAETVKDLKESRVTVGGGQAFDNDLRGVSGLGLGDGIKDHTSKWMQSSGKSPMQWIKEAEPVLVEGPVVASYGSE
ncbi:hypothetical protein QJQ45_011741 [Haematococcus lacustris]|nr:hypothetical protein QJQ45_011741 [Haematococcus lacustris]